MNYTEIILTEEECARAKRIGKARHSSASSMNLQNKHGACQESSEAIHITGAAGELSAARAMNVYWPAGVDTFKQSDLLFGVEVRTRRNHDYDLIVRPDDSDDRLWLLVTGEMPNFRVHGGLCSQEAKKDQYRQDYGGRGEAFFVPKDKLLPLADFLDLIHDRHRKWLKTR